MEAQDVNKNLKAKFKDYQIEPTVNKLLLLTFGLCPAHSLVCFLYNMNRKLDNRIFHFILYINYHMSMYFTFIFHSLSCVLELSLWV